MLRAIKASVAWNAVSVGTKFLTEFGVRLGLAKVLSPDDFGAYYFGLAIVAVAGTLPAAGLLPALINRPRDVKTASVHQAAFTFMSIASLSTFIAVLLVVGWVYGVFGVGRENVAAVALLSISILVIPFVNIYTVTLSRSMQFNKISVSEISGNLLFTCSAFVFAFSGFGCMGLVFSFLAGQGMRVFMLGRASKFLISKPNWRHVNTSLFERARFYFLGGVVATIRMRSDVLVLGSLMGSHSLGIYTFAFAITDSVQSQIAAVVNKTMFPVYSRLSVDAAVRNRYFLKVATYSSLIMFPLFVSMFFLSDWLVVHLFGEQWLESIPVIKVLSVAGIVYAFGGYPSELINASGRPDLTFKISLVNYLFFSLPTLCAFSYFWGEVGAAYSVLLHYVFLRSTHVVVLNMMCGVKFRDLVITVIPACVVSFFLIFVYISFR